MKIKITHVLYTISILTLILILIIIFLPNNILRIIIGLPFVLFFPGYTFIAALFPRKSSLDSVEKVALSFGLSIAIVPLIGLILNYTPWGIHLNSILISMTIFIAVSSIFAWYRQFRLLEGEKPSVSIHFPSWQKQSVLDKVLSIVLAVAILGVLGTIGFVIAKPQAGEKFTEFYILGSDNKAADYPSEFKLGPAQTVVSVQYGENSLPVSESRGRITLGIVNHEQQPTSYMVKMEIDGQQAAILFNGETVSEIGPLVLPHEGKWESEIGIIPQHVGMKQKVELFLCKDGSDTPYLNIHLWINVTQQ